VQGVPVASSWARSLQYSEPLVVLVGKVKTEVGEVRVRKGLSVLSGMLSLSAYPCIVNTDGWQVRLLNVHPIVVFTGPTLNCG
jgi:hypothetical protein